MAHTYNFRIWNSALWQFHREFWAILGFIITLKQCWASYTVRSEVGGENKRTSAHEIGRPGSDGFIWTYEYPWECVSFVLFQSPLAVSVFPFLKLLSLCWLLRLYSHCILLMLFLPTFTLSPSFVVGRFLPEVKLVEGMKGYWEALVPEVRPRKLLARERVSITKNCLKVCFFTPPCLQ